MGQKILGLDFGTYSIKGTLIERHWREFTVLDVFERENDADLALNVFQQMGYNLQKFLEDNPLPPDTTLMVALPAPFVRYRFLELPFSNLKKIDHAMEFELENYVPVDMEKVWSDYHVLSTNKHGSHVLSAYTQIDDFRAFLAMLEQHAIEPKQIGAALAHVSHLSRVALLPTSGHYVLLDVGHRSTGFVAFEGEFVRTLRTLGMGGEEITKALASALDISTQEAERIKRHDVTLHPYLEGTTLSRADEVVQEVLRDWMVQIRQAVAAYEQEGARRRIDALYLFGGGSRLSGLTQVLSSVLKVNVVSLDSLAFTPHHLRDRAHVMPTFVSSFAIALSAVSAPKQVRLNFRRGEFAYRGDIEDVEAGLKKAAVWLALILGIGLLHYNVSHSLMSGRADSVRRQMKQILVGPEWTTPMKSKTFGLNAALSLLNQKTQSLEERQAILMGSRTRSPLLILQTLSERLPAADLIKLNVDTLTITETTVKLEGSVMSREELDKIEAALRETPIFSEVKREKEERGQKEGVQFKLSLMVRGEEV